jgi:hypothetical protein
MRIRCAAKCCKRPKPGPAGLIRRPPAFEDFAPTLVRTFQPPSPRSWRVEVHPSVRFTSPSEHCDFRPAPATHDTGPCGPPSLDQERLPWGFLPSSRRQPAASTHAQGFPSPCFGPSTAFLTPTTVYATTGLAGLFRPATAYRVRPSGDCPPPGARTGFPARLPSCRWTPHSPVLTPGRTLRPRLQGFALQTDAVVAGNGEVDGSSAPLLGLRLPRVFSPRTVRPTPGIEPVGPHPPATFTAMNPPQLIPGVLLVRGAAGVAVS